MTEKQDETGLQRDSRPPSGLETLRQRAGQVDDATATALAAARRAALRRAQPQSPLVPAWRWRAPLAGAFAMGLAVVAAVAVVDGRSMGAVDAAGSRVADIATQAPGAEAAIETQAASLAPFALLEDMDLLEDLDLLEEMEFLAWLADSDLGAG